VEYQVKVGLVYFQFFVFVNVRVGILGYAWRNRLIV
jgi:hypothetical protein